MNSTLTFREFAAVVHMTVQNLRRIYGKHADQMPPKVVMPGGRKIVFRQVDIEQWLAARVGVKSTCPVPSPRRGRPRNIDQIKRGDKV